MSRRDIAVRVVGVAAAGVVTMGADCCVRRDRDCDEWRWLDYDEPLRAADHGVAVGPGGALAVAVEDLDGGFPYFRFEPRDSDTDADLHAVVEGYDSCPSVTVGDRGTIRFAYDDEATWHTPEVPATAASLRGLAADCPFTTAVAVGDGGTVLVAHDTIELWQARPSGTDRRLRAVALAGELIVAVGDGGTVLRSVDLGDTWAPVAVGTTADLLTVKLALSSDEGQPAVGWIGAADGGLLQSEDDGETWTAIEAGITEPVRQFGPGYDTYGNYALPLNFLGDTGLWVWDLWSERLERVHAFDEPVHAFTWAGPPTRGSELTVFVDGGMFAYLECQTCGP